MAVTVSEISSSLTLSRYLKVFSLSLKHDSRDLWKTYRTIMLFITVFLYVAGLYFKLEDCAGNIVILRYVDLFLHQIRFILNVIDVILPLFARDNLSHLIELLDSTKGSHKKTILFHALLNYCLIIFQLVSYVISLCSISRQCIIVCMVPYFTSYTLMIIGFFRCTCVLILLKHRVIEVSDDLSRKLLKISATDTLTISIKQVDELLRGIHAFGRCFGIQLALQFVGFEGVVVQNVVMVKKVPVGVPFVVNLPLMETTLVSGFYCMLTIVVAGKISEEFKKMGRKCSYALLRTKEKGLDGVLQKELGMLLDQIKYRQTKISAFGFYDITYTTFLKMIGYMSTYIIVALQFPSSS